MYKRNSLRGRLVASYLLLALTIGGVCAASCLIMVETIEATLIDDRLARAAKLWEQDAYRPISPETFDLTFLFGDQLPPSLRHLPTGTHEIQIDGREPHVLIGEINGERYAVIDDQSDFEAIEFKAFIALAATFIGGLVLAVVLARTSANRVILPLSKLAQAVQDDRWSLPLPGLNATDEIGVLAHAIDDRTSQLHLALRRERWFTADVSHELRTPLTVMLGAAEVLAKRLANHPELLPMVERIRRNAADTGQQVGTLLQLARAPETAALTRVNLRALIANELERCQPLLRDKAVKLELLADAEISIQSVPELVAIMVGNLLRNACQYTEQGLISVYLGTDRIIVSDSGTGIPETLRARIFDRFVQGDDERGSGIGLGLSIVKRVAEHLGWSVAYSPRSEGGSEFSLLFSPS